MASIFVSVSGFSCANTLLWRGSEKKKSLHSTSFLFSGMCWASWWVFDVFHFNTDSDSSPGWDSLSFLLFISHALSLSVCLPLFLSISLFLNAQQNPSGSQLRLKAAVLCMITTPSADNMLPVNESINTHHLFLGKLSSLYTNCTIQHTHIHSIIYIFIYLKRKAPSMCTNLITS